MPPDHAASLTLGAALRHPVVAKGRIEVLDVLRGVAICGILLMTIGHMGSVMADPVSIYPAALNAPWLCWTVQTLLIDGTMRGLFTMLFGASMLLMLKGSEGPDGNAWPINVWARRAIVLMAFGIVQWLVFLWPGEILWSYGLSALFLLAFRTQAPRRLLVAALGLLVLLAANNGYRTEQSVAQLHQGRAAMTATAAGRAVSADDREAIAAVAREQSRTHPTPAETAERIGERTHWRSLLRWSELFWEGENIGATGWLDLIENLAAMLIGMALYRTGWLTGQARAGSYRWWMVIGYGGGLAGRALAVWLGWCTGLDTTSLAAPVWAWAVSDLLFEPARLLVTMGHAALIITLFKAGAFGEAKTLRALGRMALTVYSLQAIGGSLIFYAGGQVGRFDLPGLWMIAVGIWAATAVFCRWWLSRFAMGPAEVVLRMLSRGEWPGLRLARVG